MRERQETEDGRLRRWETEEERMELVERSRAFVQLSRRRLGVKRAVMRAERDCKTDVEASKARVAARHRFWARQPCVKLRRLKAIIATVKDPPKWISHRHLREEIDCAVAKYRVSKAMFDREWPAKRKRLDEVCQRFEADIALLLKDDDPGRWVASLLPYAVEDGKRGKPLIVEQIESARSLLKRSLPRLVTDKGAPVNDLGETPAKEVLDGPPAEGLVGELADVYEKRFQRKASASGGSHNEVRGDDGSRGYDRSQTEFEHLVLAVCAEAGIKIKASSIPVHLSRFRKRCLTEQAKNEPPI
jgi:hypothetical protein